ncbi:MAG: hypothetical protein M3N05_00250 [Pseudomonadota bacterium]|nr:hypothetical protein [Pseudomonadota bacterium]
MPPPILSRTNQAHNANTRYCGAFTFTEDWAIVNRVAGVILQKVTRTLTVQEKVDAGGLFTNAYTMAQAATAFDPQNTALYLNTMTYWELFDVAAAGAIHGDQFQSNWFAKTNAGQPVVNTKGTYRIVGESRFYGTNLGHAALGFPGPNLPIANGLASTTADPTANFAGILPAVTSNLVTRTVTASWDCGVVTNPPNARGVTQLAIT